MLKKCIVFSLEHLRENPLKHIHNDGVARHLVLLAFTYSGLVYLGDVLIVDTHQPEALAWSQLSNSVNL